MINTTHLPTEVFGEPTAAEKLNARYRESDYFKELHKIASKHQVTDLFIANSITRFKERAGIEATGDDVEQVLNNVLATLAKDNDLYMKALNQCSG